MTQPTTDQTQMSDRSQEPRTQFDALCTDTMPVPQGRSEWRWLSSFLTCCYTMSHYRDTALQSSCQLVDPRLQNQWLPADGGLKKKCNSPRTGV
jgi:hypothetical protein